MKFVIILRGVSGSGKTTFAENCIAGDPFICCADDYFIDKDGDYDFDASKLRQAHEWCQGMFREAVVSGYSSIVVANTNTTPREFKVYEDIARENGYNVFHLVVENRHGHTDIHSVPSQIKTNQARRLSQNIQL